MAYEDLTTFTEQDPNGYWSQTSTRNTFTNLPNGDTSYIYKDYGVGHFSGDFEHWFEFQRGSNAGHVVGVWGLTDSPGTFISMTGYYFLLYADGAMLGDKVSGFADNDFSAFLSAGTTYYVKIWRTSNKLECKIYPTASDRDNDTNEVKHFTVNNVDTSNYRYLQVGFSYGVGGSTARSGWSENFNLNPGAPEILELEDSIVLTDDFQSEQSISQGEGAGIGDIISISYFKQEDISNDFRSRIEVTENINNKFNSVIQVLSDIGNNFKSSIQKIYHIVNDFRSKARSLTDISNDFRMRTLAQTIPTPEAGDPGIQSLGKEHIKVYFNGGEVTDVDIDSITITKSLNSAHTASFRLGRAYDSSKPSLETSVEIKYYVWTLYKGYITRITPTDSPDTININCQDEYWYQNRTNKYFFVGHEPQDENELYYSTIANALAFSIGWNPGIGYFIPQTMNLFGVGKSEATTNLITNSGNYGWFYDVNGNHKLWTANKGDVISLERQEIGKNLRLHQVINHSFDESAENIINRLRVQMGEKVIRRRVNNTGGTQAQVSYKIQMSEVYGIPAWDDQYEVLAKDSSTGYGVFWHPSNQKDNFKDVFTKWYLPELDSNASEWSDEEDPVIEIKSTSYSEGWELSVTVNENNILEEGFSIDYENGTVTFDEPVYYKKLNIHGEIIAIKAPIIRVILPTKYYYSYTGNESEDPESVVSNDLMFFTSKLGDYPTTIWGILELTNLGIQLGYSYTNAEGERITIPSWNDSLFALDYANWQLSKTADKKISGNIKVTLDTVTFYNIDLAKRVMINNVIENPLNIISMTYNIGSWLVSIDLENHRYYKRVTSLPSRGQ